MLITNVVLHQKQVLVTLLLVPLLVAGLGLVDNFHVATGIVMLLGGGVTLLGVSLQALVQMAIDDNFRGRVMGLWTTVSIGSGAIGAVIMGVLVDGIGILEAQVMVGLSLTGLGLIAIGLFRSTN